MKAWVLEDIGNIKYKEVLKPQISENEVLVEVKAAGICGSDIPRIYQTGSTPDATDSGGTNFQVR